MRREEDPEDFIRGYRTQEIFEQAAEVVSWLKEQRELHRPLARELSQEERELLSPYYADKFLDRIRVHSVESIEIPEEFGRLAPGSFIGFTFIDTVVMVDDSPDVMFHEHVHAAQFEILGPEGMIRLFIEEAEKVGFVYYRNPLEAQAIDLERRSHKQRFDVVQEVQKGLETILKES